MKLLAALALLALSAACAPTSQAPAAVVAPSPFPPDSGAVFAGDKARELVGQCSRISPGPVEGVWTPSQADIDALEPVLFALLAEKLRTAGVAAAPGTYLRQYGGLIIGGRRIIYVNGFSHGLFDQRPDPPPLDWHTNAEQVCDGGPIVFGVEYDPATHSFGHFAFNGAI